MKQGQLAIRGRCGGPLAKGGGNERDERGWYSLAPTSLNAAVQGPMAAKKWRTCPVAETSLAAHAWMSAAFECYRMHKRGLIDPTTLSHRQRQALLVIDEESSLLAEAERGRVEAET